MFTLDVRGIERLILQLEKRSEDYQFAVDSAAKYAHQTILRRVELGQLAEGFGNYRMTKSTPTVGKYSKRWGNVRKKAGLSTNTHDLFFTGRLHKNFIIKKTKSVNKKNLTFSRTLEFTNYKVPRKKITYAELAAIQEDITKKGTGIGFQLSKTQLQNTIDVFKRAARL
jgi:hypothetical protein